MTTTITTKRGQAGFRLRDEITNLSGSPAELQMLYHVNFGQPLLDAGSRVVAPVKTVVPRNARAVEGIRSWHTYEAARPGFEEQVYFLELLADSKDESRAMLKNAEGSHAVSMSFGKKLLPCFSIWKNTIAEIDGCVTGLEPGTNFPNPRSYEGQQGRVVQLPPSGSAAFELGLEFHRGEAEVKAGEELISAIQGGREPRVYDAPQEGWCAPE